MGMSMEGYVRSTLQKITQKDPNQPEVLTTAEALELTEELFGPNKGVEIKPPSRKSNRKMPDLS